MVVESAGESCRTHAVARERLAGKHARELVVKVEQFLGDLEALELRTQRVSSDVREQRRRRKRRRKGRGEVRRKRRTPYVSRIDGDALPWTTCATFHPSE